MTELGIPVFNTPGANANAVKELILCGILIGSRRISDGINHMKELGRKGQAKERVEKDKSLFGGREIKGKKIAIIGLGEIHISILPASSFYFSLCRRFSDVNLVYNIIYSLFIQDTLVLRQHMMWLHLAWKLLDMILVLVLNPLSNYPIRSYWLILF